jgi:predicted RNA-binding protein with PUA domain
MVVDEEEKSRLEDDLIVIEKNFELIGVGLSSIQGNRYKSKNSRKLRADNIKLALKNR